MSMLSTASLILVMTQIACWHTTGHFLTAMIAKKEIEAVDKDLIPYLESVLKVLSAFTKEKQYTFIEEASFPDDIKYLNWKAFNSWHFNDNYIYYPDAPDKNLPTNPENIVWSIDECKDTLRNTKTSDVDIFLGKSFMLRYIVHLIGDIHQPLHNASIVSQQFPKGDMGGNLFKIKCPGAEDLHTFWDMCLKQYQEIRDPLTEDHYKYLSDTTDSIMTEFTREKLKDLLAKKSIADWTADAKELSVNYAYKDIEYEGAPSDEYITKGFVIVKQQLALGGYRLADALIDIFNSGNRAPVTYKLARVDIPASEVITSNKIETETF